jgi:hypothetical protein
MMLWVEGVWHIFPEGLPIAIYRGHSFLLPAKFEKCVPSDMKIMGTRVSPTLRVY